MRKSLKGILEKRGISKVLEFSDSASAIAELKKHSYINLVLLDITLQKSDGFAVLQYVRNRTVASDIPVLVVSGDASKDNIVKATDLGANDFIVKPFSVESVEAKIEQVLEAYFSPSPFLKKLRSADKLLLSQQNDLAIELYKEALAIEPDSMRAKHSIAIALDSSGKTGAAIDLLLKCIRENSSYYRNYARLADLQIKVGRAKEAIEAMTQELELNPKQSERQLTLAKMLTETGDRENALTRYRIAIKEDPKNKQAYLGVAAALMQKGDLDKTLYFLKQFRKNYPKSNLPLRAAIKYCLKSANIKRAEDFLRDDIRRNPRADDAYILLVKLFISEKKFNDAEKQLNSLLRAHADHEEAKQLLALVIDQKNKPSQSEKP